MQEIRRIVVFEKSDNTNVIENITITRQHPVENNDISRILEYTRAQGVLMDAIRELHTLTDRIDMLHEDRPSLEFMHSNLPALLASVLESRERAKRLYRNSLTTRLVDCDWDMTQILQELENAIFRTDEILSLYPRRGVLH